MLGALAIHHPSLFGHPQALGFLTLLSLRILIPEIALQRKDREKKRRNFDGKLIFLISEFERRKEEWEVHRKRSLCKTCCCTRRARR